MLRHKMEHPRSVAAETVCEWGAKQGGLDDEVPKKLKVFRKICAKFGQIWRIFLRIWQFYEQYILFVVRITNSEKRHVAYYIFAKYDQFMPNLLPKMHLS